MDTGMMFMKSSEKSNQKVLKERHNASSLIQNEVMK